MLSCFAPTFPPVATPTITVTVQFVNKVSCGGIPSSPIHRPSQALVDNQFTSSGTVRSSSHASGSALADYRANMAAIVLASDSDQICRYCFF